MRDEEISNYILKAVKLLFEKNNFSSSQIFASNLISNCIMYKTWNSTKNREIVIDILNRFVGNRNEINTMIMNEDGMIRKEIDILQGLCDHECIREEIRIKLKDVFARLNSS